MVLTAPLDHAAPDGEKIEIFAREVVATRTGVDRLPWLVFFQGGPGFASPRPSAKTGWLKRALRDYRVLLLDQRGTGLSTPVTFQTLARFPSAQATADYLKCFRADAIVQDAEWIRRELLGQDEPSGLPQTISHLTLLLAAAIIAEWLAWVAIAA
jgi:pimeloyl-ACP methyl ester carboxylesterase